MAAHVGIRRYISNALRWFFFPVLLILSLSHIFYQVESLSVTTEVKIRTKVKTASGCFDYNGVNRSHLESWPSAAGTCDRNICYFSQSVGIWIIEETCRQIEVWENPDSANCHKVSNSTAPFPACCDILQCDSSDPLPTLPPNYCYDQASNFSCWFWNTVPNPCDPAAKFYNYTVKYCKKTCGLC